MAKKTATMLCHTYEPRKHYLNGWFVSEKLDGMRAWWDGGVSRGVPAASVPWANKEKDWRLKEEVIATGLWSRMMNVVRAPDWWLDRLPMVPLDGELHTGLGEHQRLVSITKTHLGTDWTPVRYMVFDSPPIELMVADRDLEMRMGKILYKIKIRNGMPWIRARREMETVVPGTGFENVYRWLQKKDFWNETVCLHKQEQLPFATPEIAPRIESRLEEVVEKGGEGLVLRSHIHPYVTERSHYALKYKPWNDSEGVVIGYKWGRKTDLGSRLMGKMGALTVSWKGKVFDLSGFTEEEREMTGPKVEEEGRRNEGKIILPPYSSNHFPIGSVITFRYRDLTDKGVPKEARYLRKKELD